MKWHYFTQISSLMLMNMSNLPYFWGYSSLWLMIPPLNPEAAGFSSVRREEGYINGMKVFTAPGALDKPVCS